MAHLDEMILRAGLMVADKRHRTPVRQGNIWQIGDLPAMPRDPAARGGRRRPGRYRGALRPLLVLLAAAPGVNSLGLFGSGILPRWR